MSRKPPRVPVTRATPKFAPYESCIGCLRGDTDTAFVLSGSAEFVIVGLHKFTGMSIEEASATVGVVCEERYGCDPGKVPTFDIEYAIRLCHVCAAENGVRVAPVADGELPAYTEAEFNQLAQRRASGD